MNAVPRLGRRSLGSNPFGGNSRFRFRFNNAGGGWGGSRLAGRAGFRFQGDENGAGTGDRFMTLKKRMENAIASDNSGTYLSTRGKT